MADDTTRSNFCAADYAGETLDPDDWDGLSALGHRMLDDIFDYLSSVCTRPAWQPVPEGVKARLDAPLPLGPSDAAEVKGRGNWMNQLKVDPVMDPLRSDPRFKELMRRMKFSGSPRRR